MRKRKKPEHLLILIESANPIIVWKAQKRGRYKSYDVFDAWGIMEALEIAIRLLLIHNPKVLTKFEKLDDQEFMDNPKRKRRYISKEREVLYPQKDDEFAKKYSAELFGYWFATNIGIRELKTIIETACVAANVGFVTIKQGATIVSLFHETHPVFRNQMGT